MAEPISFPTPAPSVIRVRECNCGNQTFYLYEDGQVQCALCDLMHDEVAGEWTVTKNPVVRVED